MGTDQSLGTLSLFNGAGALSSSVIVTLIVMYLFEGFIFYQIYKKSGVKYPWMSWIPIAQMVPLFRTIKLSAWNTLWIVVPTLATVLGNYMGPGGTVFTVGIDFLVIGLSIWWQARLLKAFGVNPHWLWVGIGLLIPIIDFLVVIAYIVLLCMIAFHSKIRYRSDFDLRRDE